MAGKQKGAVAVAWFRREDYQRIREVSDDEMQPTFEDFETKMTQMIAGLEARGIACEKMIIDPDQLAAFAKTINAPRIDTKVRSGFAVVLFNKKHGAGK